MHYTIINDVVNLLDKFESENTTNSYPKDIEGFKIWISDKEFQKQIHDNNEPYWEGKEKGRTVESAISTLLVHINRYAKTYSKSAISDSNFATQEDFIYLITLKAFGEITKTELIKKNIQDKPVGMLIIARLLKQGWVEQTESDIDKRNKMINITEKGLLALDGQMDKIRKATDIVSATLSYKDKMQLYLILNKLERFHYPIFCKNIENKDLIKTVYEEFLFEKTN